MRNQPKIKKKGRLSEVNKIKPHDLQCIEFVKAKSKERCKVKRRERRVDESFLCYGKLNILNDRFNYKQKKILN